VPGDKGMKRCLVNDGKVFAKSYTVNFLKALTRSNELKNVLHWKPKTSYEEGLEKAHHWISQMATAKTYG
jgi:nucleoside-diphosphate-sugar epimerase